jgi:hypothetical protein
MEQFVSKSSVQANTPRGRTIRRLLMKAADVDPFKVFKNHWRPSPLGAEHGPHLRVNFETAFWFVGQKLFGNPWMQVHGLTPQDIDDFIEDFKDEAMRAVADSKRKPGQPEDPLSAVKKSKNLTMAQGDPGSTTLAPPEPQPPGAFQPTQLPPGAAMGVASAGASGQQPPTTEVTPDAKGAGAARPSVSFHLDGSGSGASQAWGLLARTLRQRRLRPALRLVRNNSVPQLSCPCRVCLADISPFSMFCSTWRRHRPTKMSLLLMMKTLRRTPMLQPLQRKMKLANARSARN